jgi:hypothetical protein
MPNNGQHTLMMETETASETLDTNTTLTWLMDQEDFIVYCHHEILKLKISHSIISGD